MTSTPLESLYRGSVKEVLGPIESTAGESVVFQYSDAFSVFDWGRLPDKLDKKGAALAILTAQWFSELESPESWREFSRSPEALALRRGNRFGSTFVELGEQLQREGLRTHYVGVWDERVGKSVPFSTSGAVEPFRSIVVRRVAVTPPTPIQVLGREIADYSRTLETPFPRLVPLEVVFRFSVPAGASLRERLREDPSYLARRGFKAWVEKGELPLADHAWDFPTLESFTKLESRDRPLEPGEALIISGLTGAQLEDLYFRTAWVAGWVRWRAALAKVTLADGKLEWGVGEDGKLFLVDAVGPDELRLTRGGQSLSKEFLRGYYRNSPWYSEVQAAKAHAESVGHIDWKKSVKSAAPALPEEHRVVATELYQALTNTLTGRKWFPNAWSLEQVIEAMRKLAHDPGGAT